MGKRSVILFILVLLLWSSADVVFSLDVLGPAANNPIQIVMARKWAMQVNAMNLADIKAKLAAGTIKTIQPNAMAIEFVAVAGPSLFGETFSDLYPVAGSKLFFKGGPVADFKAMAQNLATLADDLVKLSLNDDKAGVEAQVAKLQGACGACHAVFRGQY